MDDDNSSPNRGTCHHNDPVEDIGADLIFEFLQVRINSRRRVRVRIMQFSLLSDEETHLRGNFDMSHTVEGMFDQRIRLPLNPPKA